MECNKCGERYYKVHSCKEPDDHKGLRCHAANKSMDFDFFLYSLTYEEVNEHGLDWVHKQYQIKIKEN